MIYFDDHEKELRTHLDYYAKKITQILDTLGANEYILRNQGVKQLTIERTVANNNRLITDQWEG